MKKQARGTISKSVTSMFYCCSISPKVGAFFCLDLSQRKKIFLRRSLGVWKSKCPKLWLDYTKGSVGEQATFPPWQGASLGSTAWRSLVTPTEEVMLEPQDCEGSCGIQLNRQHWPYHGVCRWRFLVKDHKELTQTPSETKSQQLYLTLKGICARGSILYNSAAPSCSSLGGKQRLLIWGRGSQEVNRN